MNKPIILDAKDIDAIRVLALNKRQSLGFSEGLPIANDIYTILEYEGIRLLEYPIKSDTDRPAFSAALMYSTEGKKEFVFMGVNTGDYFDKQIFAIAHELYHFYTKTGSHLSRLNEDEDNPVEIKANRFAAEFLFPEATLKSIVIKEFNNISLKNIQIKTILRFIARLQCTWWLPYRSLVRRLQEVGAITPEQYHELYAVKERNLQGEYGTMGLAINEDIFLKLNRPTKKVGASPKEIEVIVRNYEDEIIDDDQFNNLLGLFNKKPSDFGYDIGVSLEDADEFDAFFNRETSHEG